MRDEIVEERIALHGLPERLRIDATDRRGELIETQAPRELDVERTHGFQGAVGLLRRIDDGERGDLVTSVDAQDGEVLRPPSASSASRRSVPRRDSSDAACTQVSVS